MATEGSELGSAAAAAKRRKIEPPRRSKSSQDAVDKVAISSSVSTEAAAAPAVRVDLSKVREAKRLAILQAQHEGCLGSYKSVDSLFGNYLVPVIPTDEFFKQISKK